MKIEIGQSVESSKNGQGVITKIITKSTGYVEVTYENGSVKKEMFKYLSAKPKDGYQPRFLSDGSINPDRSTEPSAKQKAQLAQSRMKVSYLNEDGTMNYDKYNDFLEEIEKAAKDSISW